MKCRTPQELETYVQSLNQNWRGPVEILPYKPKRSLDQNARLFWLHGLTAARLNQVLMDALTTAQEPAIIAALRTPWDKDSVHNKIYKPQFLNGQSSTRRNKMETVDDQTDYERWMCEIGVVFPEQEYE